MQEDLATLGRFPAFCVWPATVAVEPFLRGPRFSTRWAAGFRLVATRANAQLALAFYRRTDLDYRPSSLQLVRFVDGRVAEAISFVSPGYLRGFKLPDHIALL